MAGKFEELVESYMAGVAWEEAVQGALADVSIRSAINKLTIVEEEVEGGQNRFYEVPEPYVEKQVRRGVEGEQVNERYQDIVQQVYDLAQQLTQGIAEGRATELALNTLGIKRYCCRIELMTQIQFPAGPLYYVNRDPEPNTLTVTSSGSRIQQNDFLSDSSGLSSAATSDSRGVTRRSQAR